MTYAFEEYYVKRSGMSDFLNQLEMPDNSIDISLYVTPDTAATGFADLPVPELPERIVKQIDGSPSGAAVFLGKQNYLVIPPFPIREKVIFTEYMPEPLTALLEKDYEVGLVLVHLGSYAIGVCRGERLVSSKVGSGHIQGRTKKGGSSSARYQRRRQNQGREFLDRVCLHAREHLEPGRKSLDYIQYGGPRLTVMRLKKDCPFLAAFEVKMLPLMEVPPLKQKILESSVTRMWSSRIITWHEE